MTDDILRDADGCEDCESLEESGLHEEEQADGCCGRIFHPSSIVLFRTACGRYWHLLYSRYRKSQLHYC